MSNVVEGVQADHHKYVIAKMIDPAVVAEQSRIQMNKRGESSYVHFHKADEPCEGHQHDSYGQITVLALPTEVNNRT